MQVHILATVRPGQEAFAYCVFETLRVGFPTADITVHLNGESAANNPHLKDLAQKAKCTVVEAEETIHHKWIEKLLFEVIGPFWICDTDVVFYESMEQWSFDGPLAGALIPEFNDEFTKTITRSRLHTSLLYIDPEGLTGASTAWLLRHPDTPFNPVINLVHPVMLPLDGRTYFHDTLSLAYHAVGGNPFTARQKDALFHFHFGTLGDVVLPHLKDSIAMEANRERVLAHPELGRGMWRDQEAYFNARQFVVDGTNVIAPVTPEDAQEARKWNVALCRGDESAMTFCDLYYGYVHGIDDLVDTLRDGRPRMSKDQMVGLFFRAALLYNSDFYIAHRNLLAPIILQVTNTYRDSIAWEHSPKAHLRQMGDVFRTCGNEIFVMVALLCGGEEHMRTMSMAIKERDFVLQHDGEGNPL